MLEHWGTIVADFRREYRINLYTELDSLSWNHFLMLLSNLSPESGWIRMNIYENQKPWEFEPYDPEKHGDWNTYQMLKFEDYAAWREFHGQDMPNPFSGGK